METKISKSELVAYLAEHTRLEALKHFQIGYKTLMAYMALYGFDLNFRPRKELPPKDEFIAYYNGHTHIECQQHFKIGDWLLARCMDEYGISPMEPTSRVSRPTRKALRDFMRTHANTEAAAHFGVDTSTIKSWRKSWKIAKRPARTLTFTEAARAIGVSKMTISHWNRQGLIKGVIKTKHLSFVPIDEVKRLKESYENQTAV